MNKIKLHLKPGIGADNLVEVDGKDLASLVHNINLRFTAWSIPELTIELAIIDCEVSAEGIVHFNGIPVDDNIAQQVYSVLREKFEQQ